MGRYEMTKEFQALTDQVTQNTTVEASAIELIQGIAAQLAEVKEDPAAVSALADQLKASASALGVAVTANTPAGVMPYGPTPPVNTVQEVTPKTPVSPISPVKPTPQQQINAEIAVRGKAHDFS
jgi:hypothetical protein